MHLGGDVEVARGGGGDAALFGGRAEGLPPRAAEVDRHRSRREQHREEGRVHDDTFASVSTRLSANTLVTSVAARATATGMAEVRHTASSMPPRPSAALRTCTSTLAIERPTPSRP